MQAIPPMIKFCLGLQKLILICFNPCTWRNCRISPGNGCRITISCFICLYIMLLMFCSHMVKVRDVNRSDLDWMLTHPNRNPIKFWVQKINLDLIRDNLQFDLCRMELELDLILSQSITFPKWFFAIFFYLNLFLPPINMIMCTFWPCQQNIWIFIVN